MRRLSDGKTAAVNYATLRAPRPWAVLYAWQARATGKVGPWNSQAPSRGQWPRCVVRKVAELPMADVDPMALAPFALIVPVEVMLPPLI